MRRALSTTARVELLWWDGCPSHPQALSDLRQAMAELGLDPAAVDVREVSSEEQAAEEGFIGSPTIRVNGRDVAPPPAGEPTGLSCRVYTLRDGRIAAVPDPDDLRDALRRALEHSA
jgi:hypothetical protein